MIWVRKGFVHLLALLLLVSLLGAAFATSAYVALSHPQKIETWLSQSNLYGNFVSGITKESEKSAGSAEQSDSVSLSDTAVQQAAQSAFSSQLLQQNVNTFLDSNYAWLQGKTDKPDFVIDLTEAKQTFAQQVGKYVEVHLASLPACSAAESAQMANVDPLNTTCRPASVNPQTAGADVTQKLGQSGDFLSNPVVTASTINPNATSQSEPYYKKLSFAPTAYRWGVKLPWILGLLALLIATAIIFAAPQKRKGFRRVGMTLLVAGVLLVVIKFVADVAFTQVEKKAFNKTSVGPLQHSLTNFAHRLETELVKIDLWFGVALLLLAATAFIVLARSRNQTGQSGTTEAAPAPPTTDVAEPATPTTPSPAPKLKPAQRPKRPRLIQ